jgi:lipopolysaccharide export system permease protein
VTWRRLVRPLPLIDHYLLRHLARWYVSIIAVITFILVLQTMPGFLRELVGVQDPVDVLARSLLNLLPEYVAIAVPIALFLSTALTFRGLALTGEFDVLAAIGIGDWRLLRQPLLLGAMSALLVLLLRFYVQPAGERSLDLISAAVRSGEFGLGLAPATPHSIAPGVTLFFGRADSAHHRIEKVAFSGKEFTAFAASASLQRTRGGGVLVSFNDGTLIPTAPSKLFRTVRFRRFSVLLQSKAAAPQKFVDAREQLDRLDFERLFGPPVSSPGLELTPARMRAAAAARIAAGLFGLVLPIFGFALGVPPKRSRSAIGLGVGLVVIIIFWRVSALIENRGAEDAILLHLCLLGSLLGVALALVRYQRRNGPGAVEGKLNQWAVQAYRAFVTALRRSRRFVHLKHVPD